MKKILTREIGNLKGTIYLASLGYTYKIWYGKKLVDRCVVYLISKELAEEKMVEAMEELGQLNVSLFEKV